MNTQFVIDVTNYIEEHEIDPSEIERITIKKHIVKSGIYYTLDIDLGGKLIKITRKYMFDR